MGYRHEQAKIYQLKSKIVGDGLEFELMPEDRVALTKVNENSKRIVIPSFVTDIGLKYSHNSVAGSPFTGSKCQEICIDNSPDIDIDLSYLCFGMVSEKLKIWASHPERIINMNYMVFDCRELKELDISGLAGNHAKTMIGTFNGCESLEKIVMGNFDAQYCENLTGIFYRCSSIESLDLSRFKANKLLNINNMFGKCYKLKSINLNNFNTDNVISMDEMFESCNSLENLDLKSMRTNNVKSAKCMFSSCRSLEYLDLSSFIMHEAAIAGMFSFCVNLKTIDMHNIDFNTLNPENSISKLFLGCHRLHNLKLNHTFPNGKYLKEYMIFTECFNLDKTRYIHYKRYKF